ncbi:bifunctional enzyme IspD/IspF [Alsobacter metallidurans]|uniref:Bifunctional enzyme IspD/IspF n=1 Tax=Alsobacter metallidurans TaxID=340221 RepID=A0A917I712_9HYPH|nr:bifunctional 2-C-methyl-D-erythritol 4-phosphate cytidylyltransferase/2-C-methyl-D-erythritol 2,4-cyclodiphosphate synthase [Alsobacter metallidurans]GGH18142.1 bifunctional enzyme IspD/IspF [Alsobacter metallidurans]
MSEEIRWAVIIVAAGKGERAGGAGPKQFRMLAGRTVLARSVQALAAGCKGAPILCVIGEGDHAAYGAALGPDAERSPLLPPVPGGSTRQGSVLRGLQSLATARMRPSHVLVHDAARPFASPELITRVMDATLRTGAAIPGAPLADTVKRVGPNGLVRDTPPRTELRAIQTPQGFAFDSLLAAHEKAFASGRADLTDDAAVLEAAGLPVEIVDGDLENVKLTRPEDFSAAEARLSLALETRVGFGYDVHAFGPGDHVMLGGVAIPHGRGLAAHSDGDVALHAITDAIFGALGDGDIGSHFSPTDMRWKGASSDLFLRYAVERAKSRGGRIDHLDVTLICEAPKIGPHREAMRARIAEICSVPLGRVGVKATTSEELGFTGRREGIAAHAVATMRLPAEPDA